MGDSDPLVMTGIESFREKKKGGINRPFFAAGRKSWLGENRALFYRYNPDAYGVHIFFGIPKQVSHILYLDSQVDMPLCS